MSVNSLSFKERMDKLRSAENRHSFHRRLTKYAPEIKLARAFNNGRSYYNYYLVKQKNR